LKKKYVNILANLKECGLNPKGKMYVFLDGIQAKPEVVRAIKYLYDHYKIKFFLSGSSSFYIKNLFPESLIDKKFIFELCPLAFEEFLLFRDKNGKFGPSLNQQDKNKNQIFYESTRKFYDEYLEYGGFPEVDLTDQRKDKILKIKDIFKSYFEKDVKNLAGFSKINSFRDLILLLAHRNGEKPDISKLSPEIGVSKMTVYSYLSFFAQC
jgi:predicted AAA+ superfamily ATPase